MAAGQTLDSYSLGVLDQMFREANASFLANDFQVAYAKCDDIKREVQRIQKQVIDRIALAGTGVGVVAGCIAPGVGNIVGGAIGGVAGRYLAKFLANRAFADNGTLEDIVELASAGKMEASSAQMKKHGKLPLNNIQVDTLWNRWSRLREEVT